MPFILGFFLSMAGFAMLVVGGFKFPGNRAVSAKAARWTGGVFVSFFPLAFAVRLLLVKLEWLESINIQIVYSVLLGLCFLIGALILFRALPKASPRAQPDSVNASASVVRGARIFCSARP